MRTRKKSLVCNKCLLDDTLEDEITTKSRRYNKSEIEVKQKGVEQV